MALVMAACLGLGEATAQSGEPVRRGLAEHPLLGRTVSGVPIWSSPYRSVDRVLIISFDGLRPDAIGEHTPTLRRIAARGQSATVARTIDHSVTVPAHASMLTGVAIETHGLHRNALRPEQQRLAVPTVFTLARAAGMESSLWVSKGKLGQLASPGELSGLGGMRCDRITRLAQRRLASVRTGAHLLHFADPDNAGHAFGWMSQPYLDAVERADGCLSRILDALGQQPEARTLLIVTSDHGGHGRTHGSDRSEDVRIPWIALRMGGGTGRHTEPIRRAVHTTDTAATILAGLGIAPPSWITGRPVRDVL